MRLSAYPFLVRIICFFVGATLMVPIAGMFVGVYAQELDRLKTELARSKPDTHRISIFYDMGYAYWLGGDDSLSGSYMTKAVVLARHLGSSKAEARARLHIARIEVDRMMYFREAFAQVDTVLQIASKLKDKHLEAQACIRKAQLLGTFIERQKEIMPLYDKALTIFKQLGDKSWQGTVYNEKGQVLAQAGQSAQAINNFLQARKLQEEANNLTALRSTLPNLGVAYSSLGLYQEALEAFDQAGKIAKKRNDKVLEAFLLNQRAEIFEKQGKYNIALKVLATAAAIHEKTGAAYWLPKTYSRMGRVYIQLRDYDNALKYTRMGDSLFQAVVDSDNFLDHVVQINFGKIYLYKKQYQQVIDYAGKGLEWAMESDPVFLVEAAEYNRQLAEAYQATGDYREALKHYKSFKADSDSLLNKESLQKATALAMNYEFDKKQNLSKLRFNQLQNEKLTQSRNFLVGLSVLATLIAGIILWSNRKLRSKNLQLTAKNREIEQALYKGQNIERKRVASELHDNLATKLAALRWRLEAIDISVYNETDQKIHAGSIQMLEDVYTDVRLISHNMLPAELAEQGLVVALQKLIDQLNTNPKTRFKFVTDGFQPRTNARVEFELYQVVLELVNNIIKHSQATVVWLNLSQSETYVTLTVSDNGIGFNSLADSDGIGLRNIGSRIDTLHGKWIVESSPQSGTKVVAKVPV